jgi:hypothetical protein
LQTHRLCLAEPPVKSYPRRGSKPARSYTIRKQRQGRAEFFALPTINLFLCPVEPLRG